MFCGKCGTNIPEGAVVCPTCGNPTGVKPSGAAAKKPLNKGLLVAIVGVVAVIALVVVLISSCGGGDPESMAENYVDALLSGDGQDIWDAMNMDAALEISVKIGELDEDEAEEQKEESIEYYDEIAEWRQEYMEDLYGEDWSYELEVTKVKEMKSSELRDYEDNLDDDDIEVEEGCYVTVKVTFEGDEDDGKDKYTVTLIKVDGDWMIVS